MNGVLVVHFNGLPERISSIYLGTTSSTDLYLQEID